MTVRKSSEVLNDIKEFNNWVDDQSFIHGPSFNRVIVDFSYQSTQDSEDWLQEIRNFNEGTCIGEVKTTLTIVNPNKRAVLTDELQGKISKIKSEILVKARQEHMPLQRELNLVNEVENFELEQKIKKNREEGLEDIWPF